MAKNEDIFISKNLFLSFTNNKQVNVFVADYLRKINLSFPVALSEINNLENCNSYYWCDLYLKSQIIDYKRTFLCKSRWCLNCQKIKQASSLFKFFSLVESFKKTTYHLVLTQPNTNDLKTELDKLSKTMARFLKILQSKDNYNFFKKIKVIGTYRNLEITTNNQKYHPHFHLLITLREDYFLDKQIINQFSFSNRTDEITKFSDLEIVFQKLWYICYHNLPLRDINTIPLGFSCKLDKITESSVYEAFKYVIKFDSFKKESITLDSFKTLYISLKNKRTTNTTGIYRKLKNDYDLENVPFYDSYIKQLFLKETPIKDITFDYFKIASFTDSDFKIISKKKFYLLDKITCSEE